MPPIARHPEVRSPTLVGGASKEAGLKRSPTALCDDGATGDKAMSGSLTGKCGRAGHAYGRRSRLRAAHLADELPFLRRHRLHREAGVFHQRHVFQLRLRLDRGERHRPGQRLDRSRGDGDPRLALLGRRVGIGLADYFADADHLLLGAGVIEEELLALLHLLEMAPRGEIAHAAPRLALGAALDLVVPGKLFRLGLHQPVGHDYPSALNGRVSNDSIASSTVIVPFSSAATAIAMGMSTLRSRAMSTSTDAVNTPSARPAWIASGFWPRPRLKPKVKLRDCGLEHVSSKSPRPERPIIVSALAPYARPKRTSSAKPRVVSAAAALAPRPRPLTIPAAIASTFLAAPPISTPRTSAEW